MILSFDGALRSGIVASPTELTLTPLKHQTELKVCLQLVSGGIKMVVPSERRFELSPNVIRVT